MAYRVTAKEAPISREPSCPWQVASNHLQLSSGGGVAFQESVLPPRLTLSSHYHESAILCMVLQGGFEERYRGTDRDCAPLEMVYYAPQAWHAGSFSEQETRLFSIHFSPAILSNRSESELENNLDKESFRAMAMAVMIPLFREFRDSDPSTTLHLESLATELLSRFEPSVQQQRYGRPPWLARVRDLLVDRMQDPPSLAELAREASVHPCHLVRAFRQMYGYTISDFVHRKRIAGAINRMASPKATLSATALEAGFADQSHFGRVFKRVTGYSPGAYRRVMRR